MSGAGRILADIRFVGEVIIWRGPAPFHFVAVPSDQVAELHYAAQLASYGWGVVPVAATACGVDFTTSLFPKDGGYLLPIKAAVRKEGPIEPGDRVPIRIRVMSGTG